MLRLCREILIMNLWDIFEELSPPLIDTSEKFSYDPVEARKFFDIYRYKMVDKYGLSICPKTGTILKILDEEKAAIFILSYA